MTTQRVAGPENALSAPVRRTSEVELAIEALRKILPDGGADCKITVPNDLVGIVGLLPLRIQASDGAYALVLAFLSAQEKKVIVCRSDAIEAQALGPEFSDDGLVDLYEQLTSIANEDVAFLGRPLAARHLESGFYMIEGPDASALMFLRRGARGDGTNVFIGPGFGTAEQRASARTLTMGCLPVDSSARVIWGGPSMELNRHIADRSQRHAIDLEPLPAAIDQVVLSPTSGRVKCVVDGELDNELYRRLTPQAVPFGNHVRIECRDDVEVLLCHLKHNSVRVRQGQIVKSGDEIGLTGNSGQSSIPHLHCHAQQTVPPYHGIRMLFPVSGRYVELVRGMELGPIPR